MVVARLAMWVLVHRKEAFQLNKCLLLGIQPEKILFHSTLGNFTEQPSDMRESQHKTLIEIGKAQKVAKIS